WNIGYAEGQLSDYRKYRMECRKTDDVINLIIFISYIDIEEAWDEELLEYLEKEGLFVKMSDSFPYKIETEVDSNDNVFWSVNITVCDKNHSYIHSPIGMTKFS
ncbi:MAG: hypothetical protein PHC92_09380, partial [Syntrophomonadaceae bacterium]|nr:hypothetical protein [Syntrophomonadaceae bacterium]